MAIGVCCRFSLRNCAVTTISCSWSLEAALGAAAAGCVCACAWLMASAAATAAHSSERGAELKVESPDRAVIERCITSPPDRDVDTANGRYARPATHALSCRLGRQCSGLSAVSSRAGEPPAHIQTQYS